MPLSAERLQADRIGAKITAKAKAFFDHALGRLHQVARAFRKVDRNFLLRLYSKVFGIRTLLND